MSFFMGIDGGGSNLRVAIVDSEMETITIVRRGSANPNVIGRDQSAHLIQDAMQEALQAVENDVVGVGVGIAGASAVYASDWLHEVIRAVLPDTTIAAASDIEIALVGAHGRREGILLLAGTGSVILGINAEGQMHQAGGWGYLLGDEGSGYWIGLQALKGLAKIFDGQFPSHTSLQQRIIGELQLDRPTDLIRWVYGQKPSPVAEIAKFARMVLEEAEARDDYALGIIQNAATDLAHMVRTVIRVLNFTDPQIAFAGGLLETPNILSQSVSNQLGLEEFPTVQYPPVIGAALLAKSRFESDRKR